MPLKEERHRRILAAVRESQHATVADLSHRFAVSEVTIRRDLRELATRGMLRRTHGGAVAAAPAPASLPVIHRLSQDESYKMAIGRAAAALISDGESVFVGSGSTASYVARHLARRSNLTVVTNALTVAMELAPAEHITVVVTGGVLRASELSLIGSAKSEPTRSSWVSPPFVWKMVSPTTICPR
jgi:DeoR/GlpR family transcriptional regulator of sugar metabolism